MAPPDPPPVARSRLAGRALPLLLALYPAWLAMMALHEAGHVLHALTSGGRVVRVSVPPLGFSQTDVSPNPHPQWVAWGGPLWGCALALATLLIPARRATGRRTAARVFAGFCLIANGAYIGLGPFMTAGDGHDLIRHGAPPWTLLTFGAASAGVGLYLWHLASARPPRTAPATAA